MRFLLVAGLAIGILFCCPLVALSQTLPPEEHPSLLFDSTQIPILKERILREPYATWWETVLSRAESVPTTIRDERTKARLAKSLAFAYLMTDEVAFAQRGVELLTDMKFPPRGGDLGEPHNEGEVLVLYALAYDMVHNFLQENEDVRAEIRSILAEEAQRLYEGVIVEEVDLGLLKVQIRLHETLDPRNVSKVHLDNWHVRAYGGLGMAAFALSDHPGKANTPQQWADHAFELVTASLWHQIDATDGGYAEGPFYSRYAADVYLPYMFALKNLTGVDLFVDPKVQKMHEWSLNIRLPSGRRPNIEDGHLDDFYGHYLAAVYADGGKFRWDWENNLNGLYVREYSEMDAIALYDDSIEARAPDWGPTIFMPAAGDAVFRSDWSADATYMLLRGEHGRTREQGFGHEHPDETSFIIYAGGEMLALDAGYISFPKHGKVNRGPNHNVILIDGEGPPNTYLRGESMDGGNDAFIEDFFASKVMDYAEVRANYSDVDILRRVMFIDKDYFIVADELRDRRTHTYEWRLHGNGGGSSGGSYQRSGNLARWSRPGAELLAFLVGGGAYALSERDTLHSFEYLEERTHTMLRAEQTGDNVEFLTVLYPRRVDQEEPNFISLGVNGGQAVRIEYGEVRDLSWLQKADAGRIFFGDPQGAIDSDGDFGFVRYKEDRLRNYSVQDGSYLKVAGEVAFRASEMIDLSLEITPTRVRGHVRGSDSGYRLSLPMLGSVEAVRFNGKLLDMALEDHVLSLDLQGEGVLSLARDTTIRREPVPQPLSFQLFANYPNPFNRQTIIAYQIPQQGPTRLSIYNMSGQPVVHLVDEVQPAGSHQVSWDGKNNRGEAVASGVYVYRLKAGEGQKASRLLLLK